MTPTAIRDVLAFYAEAGVDAAIGEAPNDYLNAPPAAPSPGPSVRPRESGDEGRQGTGRAALDSRLPGNDRVRESAPKAPAASTPPNAEAAVMAAREAAHSAASLDELRAI